MKTEEEVRQAIDDLIQRKKQLPMMNIMQTTLSSYISAWRWIIGEEQEVEQYNEYTIEWYLAAIQDDLKEVT